MTMFSRQRPAISSALMTCGEIEPNSTIFARSIFFLENLRMVMTAPSIASGGITALTRQPSGRRQSTRGLNSSTRRPTPAAIFWAIAVSCSELRNLTEKSWASRPLRSTNTAFGPFTMISVTLSS